MKKLKIKAAALAIAAITTTNAAAAQLGDADNDGIITAADSLLISIGAESSSIGLDTAIADVDSDGRITSADAELVLKKTLNQSFVFPESDAMDSERFAKTDALIKKLMRETTPQSPMWNTEKLGRENWNYVNGCMMKAFVDLYAATGNNEYMDYADNFMDYYINEDGSIPLYSMSAYNLDNINSGKVLFDLYAYTGKEKYNKAADTLYAQLEKQPRTNGGNFWHKQTYPYQVWLDGLYMAMPFYARYDGLNNASGNFEDIYKQYKNVYEILRDKNTGLYYHGYDESRAQSWADLETGLSANVWLRACAWYAMSLVDTIELLPSATAEQTAVRREMTAIFSEMMSAMRRYQDDSGLWYQVVDKAGEKGNYLETSGSAGLAYSMLKGARLGYLPQEYYTAGKKAFNALCDDKLSVNGSDIVLKDICIVAGLGGSSSTANGYKSRDGSYEYYIAEKVGTNDAKAAAPLIYAYCELLRLER